MTARTLARALAGALGVAAAVATPAAAQSAADAALRPVATYHIGTRNHDRTMPAKVVVADSAGRLVANYYLTSDTTAHHMGVIAYEGDLVLVGETKRGVLEMVLDDQLAGPTGKTVTGRWSRGEQESGRLRGHVKR